MQCIQYVLLYFSCKEYVFAMLFYVVLLAELYTCLTHIQYLDEKCFNLSVSNDPVL